MTINFVKTYMKGRHVLHAACHKVVLTCASPISPDGLVGVRTSTDGQTHQGTSCMKAYAVNGFELAL